MRFNPFAALPGILNAVRDAAWFTDVRMSLSLIVNVDTGSRFHADLDAPLFTIFTIQELMSVRCRTSLVKRNLEPKHIRYMP